MTESYRIRALRQEEAPFVLANFVNSWVKNQISHLRDDRGRWRSIPTIYRCLSTDTICSYYHDQMEHHLSTSQCLVAGDEGDSVLLGYVVYSLSPNVLYWVYCKSDFKGFGVELDMIRACLFDPEKPVLVPYRNSGLSRLLKEAGFRD